MHVGGKCQKCQMYSKLTSCRYNTVSQKNLGTSQMHWTCTQTLKALWMTREDLHTCQKQSETPKTIQMHQTFLVEAQRSKWYKNNCKDALKRQKEQTETLLVQRFGRWARQIAWKTLWTCLPNAQTCRMLQRIQKRLRMLTKMSKHAK